MVRSGNRYVNAGSAAERRESVAIGQLAPLAVATFFRLLLRHCPEVDRSAVDCFCLFGLPIAHVEGV